MSIAFECFNLMLFRSISALYKFVFLNRKVLTSTIYSCEILGLQMFQIIRLEINNNSKSLLIYLNCNYVLYILL